MTMPHPETYPTTQRGATRQTRRRPPLLPVLKEMMDGIDNPHAHEDRESVKAQFLQFMNTKAGAPYTETAFLYWFDNNYRSLLRDYPEPDEAERKATAQAQRKQKAAMLAQNVDKAITERAQLILLDWVLPNGKALRDCTGRECRQMSGKVGGWLRKISDRIKPTDLVGKVLQEADVRKFYGKD